MLELKLRAWNPAEEEMSFPFNIGDGHDGVYIHDTMFRSCKLGVCLSDCILEEYTGLKDKNGKEIFQNDIIEDIQGITYRVYKWYGGFVIKIPAYAHEKRDLDEIDCLVTMSLSDSQTRGYIEHSCEIIGNTHENKELLEQ